MVQDVDTGNLVMVPIVRTSCLASWVLLDPSKMCMHLLDLRLSTTIGRTPRPVINRITNRQTPGTVTVVTCQPSTTLRTGIVSIVIQGKDRIIKNLVASLWQATRKGVGTTTRQPGKLWAPLWDGDQVPPQDGAPLNLGNPRFGTRFADKFPDTLVGMNSKLIDRVLHSGTKSTIMSRIPSTSWT